MPILMFVLCGEVEYVMHCLTVSITGTAILFNVLRSFTMFTRASGYRPLELCMMLISNLITAMY